MHPLTMTLLSTIGIAGLVFAGTWAGTAAMHPHRRWPSWLETGIGFVTDFFDALGIGSFATTTTTYRLLRLVPDEDIPGTLNVGHGPAALAEALIFISVVAVDPWLLAAMTAAAAVGAWVGASIVTRLPRRRLQLLLGAGLCVAGLLFVAVNLGLLPGGGAALALSGWRFGTATAINFALGALMASGIGIFAPCMITLALLGMNPIAAFPIMMASGALQQMVSGSHYLRSQRYAFGPAVGLAIGGVAGVVVAAYIVHSLPMAALRWLVAFVALYAAAGLLRSAAAGPASAKPALRDT